MHKLHKYPNDDNWQQRAPDITPEEFITKCGENLREMLKSWGFIKEGNNVKQSATTDKTRKPTQGL
jgi:hypothetical protein